MIRRESRLDSGLPRDVFTRLISISRSQRWLLRRQEKINSLFSDFTDEKDQSFLCDLLERFTYIDGETLADSLEEIGRKITIDWGCTPENTLVAAMDKSRYADSSSAVAWMIKPVLADLGDWETHKIYKKLTDLIDDVSSGQKIVIVDEFVGSGETLSKRLKWIRGELGKSGKSVEIYVATIAAMELVQSKDLSDADDFHTTVWLKQGINDYYSGEELTAATDRMIDIEGDLLPEVNFLKLSKYSLGYKKTQSTYYLENGNPPNNNFPVFWWKMRKSGQRRRPLIPRV